ncbi:uncharacterized protein MYCFIDRAFT_172312 [Pseudocercospora fijiensis CIRAD86]|uniref:Uncharacterized protein n=1 Tax=Pseudocercospora fijiensis (strain CIRAD86) TaxID=383855 RepID=M3BBJ5_PSEFD|nr:uncharacterized protein MYCFIDRAFT_172312 [Pseudocercospora fijiensis CIRAD86]EME86593.1 hypothetical protein MYCFIDRAFT_172312 [Pseudocercospora fijiensis CIRAD86]
MWDSRHRQGGDMEAVREIFAYVIHTEQMEGVQPYVAHQQGLLIRHGGRPAAARIDAAGGERENIRWPAYEVWSFISSLPTLPRAIYATHAGPIICWVSHVCLRRKESTSTARSPIHPSSVKIWEDPVRRDSSAIIKHFTHGVFNFRVYEHHTD